MAHSTILDRIRYLFENTPPFDRLTEAERADLLADVSIEYYEPGEVVLEQRGTAHKGLFIVESGMVRLFDLEQQRLIDKCGEGDLFGTFGLIKGGARPYEAKAVEPTVCAVLKGDRFEKLYQQNPDFAAFFNSDVRQYLRRIGGEEVDVTGAFLLFSRRLGQLNLRAVVSCPPEATAEKAARLMRRQGVSALVVMKGKRLVGLLTDADLRNRLVARGRPLSTPVRALLSRDVVTLDTEATLFDAMMAMLERRARRLVVVDAAGAVVGLISDRDMAHYRGQDPVATMHRIGTAASAGELAGVRVEINEQLLRLDRLGVQPEQLNRIMAHLYDHLSVRVLELVEKNLRRHAETRVDLPWAWLRLGGGGRREVALTSQQYNALVYANPADEAEAAQAERWFEALARAANEALEACGFPAGDVVAQDPRWRLPLRAWKKTFRSWVLQPPDPLPGYVPLMFDLRGIYGQTRLVDELRQDVEDALNVQALSTGAGLPALLAARALEARPPLSFFRRFALERSGEQSGTFDIRERGIVPVVEAARALALEQRMLAPTSTFSRLRHVAEAVPELERTVEAALYAYQYLVDFRLEQQLRAVEAGEAPRNNVDPSMLTKMQQNLLRRAFSDVAQLQEALARRYNVPRRGLLRAGLDPFLPQRELGEAGPEDG